MKRRKVLAVHSSEEFKNLLRQVVDDLGRVNDRLTLFKALVEEGEFVASFKTASESLLLVANGHDTKRVKPGARVDREKLREIDLHWHDLRHEGA